jgi:hypothetical protein
MGKLCLEKEDFKGDNEGIIAIYKNQQRTWFPSASNAVGVSVEREQWEIRITLHLQVTSDKMVPMLPL